jgi:hypothetical protein
MKYEARNVNGIATSQAAGLPWTNLAPTWVDDTTNDVSSISSAACSGCGLVSEAQWLTIAQNVLSVASNWSGGAVGSGYIPRGNSSSSAAMDSTIDLGGINKRTLTLSNGEVIWDFAGNVDELTADMIICSGINGTNAQQPGVPGAGAAWREWPNITTLGTLTYYGSGNYAMTWGNRGYGQGYNPDPSPRGTGIAGAGNWNSNNGIGQIYSNSDDKKYENTFTRGGSWASGIKAGVLALDIDYADRKGTDIGFRIAYTPPAL